MNSLLLAALIAVESSGNPAAIGDNGKALGILQIQPAVVVDVNRINKSHYVHADALDPKKAREMATIYLNYYASKQKLGTEPTFEQMARIWNGGPQGYKKAATKNYWQKVKREMERQKVKQRAYMVAMR